MNKYTNNDIILFTAFIKAKPESILDNISVSSVLDLLLFVFKKRQS